MLRRQLSYPILQSYTPILPLLIYKILFVRRRANEVHHSLARTFVNNPSPHVFSCMPHYISNYVAMELNKGCYYKFFLKNLVSKNEFLFKVTL